MPRPPKENIDPHQIFMHADGFHKAGRILSSIDFNQDPHLALNIAQPAMVLSALNSELFLKCLICIETRKVPYGHYLDELFNQLSEPTRAAILRIWDDEVLPHRKVMWDRMEKSLGEGKGFARDLPSALAAASRAFEKIRYGYEDESKDAEFYISDLPWVLGRVILQMKPEWEFLQRRVQEIS